MSYILPTLRCRYCGHVWVPRKLDVRICPRCNHCIICGKHKYSCRCWSKRA